ncbi:MAG: hypothetical protein CML67_16335 [Rhodobacteraceae bacterium]|nr:hypothetical protein [Paracoccaceae bacterium]
MTLANSISAPAIAAGAAVTGQGARAAAAGAATGVPSMFALHLGSLGGDVSARALSAAQGAGAGGPVNAPVAGGAMASATVTGSLSGSGKGSGPGSATATGPLLAGVTAAQTTGAPFAIHAVGLGMFGPAGPGGASVLPTTPAGSDGIASAAPGAAATGSAALAGDADTETDAATPPGAGAPVTLESMAPASMSAPFAPVPSPVAGAGPGNVSPDSVLTTAQAVSATGLAASAAAAGGKSTDATGKAPGAAAAGPDDGTPASGTAAQGKAGSPPGLAPGSTAALAGGGPAQVGAPAVGAALAANNPVSALRSATVTTAATGSASGAEQITGAPLPAGLANAQASAGTQPGASATAQQIAGAPDTAPQTAGTPGTAGAAASAPQAGSAAGTPVQVASGAAPVSADAEAGVGSPSASATVSGTAAADTGDEGSRPVAGTAPPRPAVTPAASAAVDVSVAQETPATSAGASDAPQVDAAKTGATGMGVTGTAATGKDGTQSAPQMTAVGSPASGSTPGAAAPVIDAPAQSEATAGPGAGESDAGDGEVAAQADQAPRNGRDPAALRATTQMAMNAPARDLGQPVASGTADAVDGEPTSTLAKAMAGDGATGEDTASETKPPAAPQVAQPQPVRAGVSAAALAFAAAMSDGQANGGDGGFDIDGFGDFGQRGDAAQQAAASVARAAATASLPQQAAAATAHLAAEIARFASKGSTRFQIRMDPPEMGRIDVDLKVGKDGTVRAHLAVERSETLDMFLRDQRSLERALDAAGLKLENGSVQLSLKDQGGFAGFQRQDGQDDAQGAGRGGDGPAAEGEVEDLVSVSRVQVRGASGALDIQI